MGSRSLDRHEGLAKAEREHWSVRQLESAVYEADHPAPRRADLESDHQRPHSTVIYHALGILTSATHRNSMDGDAVEAFAPRHRRPRRAAVHGQCWKV